MVKFFPTMPAILESFNPEAPTEEWFGEKTFDENGELHSYNDVPIYSYDGLHKKGMPNFKPDLPFSLKLWQAVSYSWYSHGKLHREGNKPVRIKIVGEKYSTYDSEDNLHSYNDKPAVVSLEDNAGKDFRLVWFEHGVEHRENDSPATIVCSIEGNLDIEIYKTHGVIHRSNNLPARITPYSQAWKVEGCYHNLIGASYVANDGNVRKAIWSLYGMEISETSFNQIKTISDDTNIPYWAVFLLTFDFIAPEHLNSFISKEGKWNTLLPSSWILRFWNITETFFNNKALEKGWSFNTTKNRFHSFIAIVASEENDAALKHATTKE
jgi:hypothetical protein